MCVCMVNVHVLAYKVRVFFQRIVENSSLFNVSSQEDAGEFLQYIIGKVHEELATVSLYHLL